MLDVLKNYLEEMRGGLHELSTTIWNNPEIGYHEKIACAKACDFLKAQGFAVENPYCGLETAFRAQFTNGEGPVFAFCSEFDALAGLGHGCGHNLICAGGIASFCATAKYMKANNIPGALVLLGTPAEESYGGKVKMEEAGCLEGIEAVIMSHPGRLNTDDNGASAVIGYEVTFHGKASHAGGSPEKGVNALDAVMLLFAGINAYRQQLPDTARIHGIVTNGGAAANIIPDTATCRFYLRSTIEELLEPLKERFLDMVKGAELMTRAKAEISVFHLLYHATKPNLPLNRAYVRFMQEQGLETSSFTKVGRGSTDFGNFSQRIPGCHFHFSISTAKELPGHSIEMREAANSDYGFEMMLKSSAAMSEIALLYLTDAEFRREVQEDFSK